MFFEGTLDGLSAALGISLPPPLLKLFEWWESALLPGVHLPSG